MQVCTRVVLLNFCITPAGLEDQLLGIVVAKERPELEEEKSKLIITGERARPGHDTARHATHHGTPRYRHASLRCTSPFPRPRTGTPSCNLLTLPPVILPPSPSPPSTAPSRAGAENARRLVEIEDQILAVLSSNQGSILDDGEAVAVLQEAKRLSDEIAAKQVEAAKTEQAIDKVGRGGRLVPWRDDSVAGLLGALV